MITKAFFPVFEEIPTYMRKYMSRRSVVEGCDVLGGHHHQVQAAQAGQDAGDRGEGVSLVARGGG